MCSTRKKSKTGLPFQGCRTWGAETSVVKATLREHKSAPANVKRSRVKKRGKSND